VAPLTTSRLDAPTRSDLLPVEEVDALIQAADRELSTLERDAAEATAAADAMQQRVVDEGADERSSSWAMMQLRRFLDGLSDEVDREVAALIDVADRWAKQRVSEARAEAEAVRLRPRTPAEPAELEPEALTPTFGGKVAQPEPTIAPQPVVEAVPAPFTPVVVHAEPVAVAPVATPVVELSPTTFTPAIPEVIEEPLTANAAAPAPAPVDSDASPVAEPAPLAWTETPVTEGEAHATSTATSPSAELDEGRDASVAGTGDAFWQGAEREKKPKKSRFRRIPWTAVLQVIAVLAILVFILLRLS
jgi:hypothetical protein